jgi:CheY-like chemotaxis protein
VSKKATILVVDDEPLVRKLIQTNLLSSGYRVVTAADGEEAVSAVERELPDLVILDLMLPKLDGYAACRRIREFSAVPIIMLTARSAEVDLLHGFDVGADDYLTKPFAVNKTGFHGRAHPDRFCSAPRHRRRRAGETHANRVPLTGLSGLEPQPCASTPGAIASRLGTGIRRRNRVLACVRAVPATEAGARSIQPQLHSDPTGGRLHALPARRRQVDTQRSFPGFSWLALEPALTNRPLSVPFHEMMAGALCLEPTPRPPAV